MIFLMSFLFSFIAVSECLAMKETDVGLYQMMFFELSRDRVEGRDECHTSSSLKSNN